MSAATVVGMIDLIGSLAIQKLTVLSAMWKVYKIKADLAKEQRREQRDSLKVSEIFKNRESFAKWG